MKKKILIIFISLFFLLLCGCSSNNYEKNTDLVAPKNNNIEIEGVWTIQDYNVLDDEIADDNGIYVMLQNNIIIKDSEISIGNSKYDNINYKLKKVDSDYVITYEDKKTTLLDLGFDEGGVKVYSISHDNSLIGEIIYINKENSYLYYQGYLLNIKYDGKVDEKKENKEDIKSNENNVNNNINTSEGILLGLKTKSSVNSDGDYVREKYRTIWISTIYGEFQPIKEKDNIMVPRSQGMWRIVPKVYENKEQNIYYEYFDADPIDTVREEQKINLDNISNDKILKRSINYVSGDYLATEVINNEKFSESPVYEVLPIDNVFSTSPIQIGDIYGTYINTEFKKAYDNAYSLVNINENNKLSKDINYGNYTIVRTNGRWTLQGRISPIISSGKSINFAINTPINKKLSKYNILTIPWKILKGKIPLFIDAYTSPSGNIAIIIVKGEILVYTINNGQISDTPVNRIQLKNGEEVIMSEWCENDYVRKWNSYFEP